jgi:hypothetical protein
MAKGTSALVFTVLQEAKEPMSCREITTKAGLHANDAKDVATILANYKKTGVVTTAGSKICSETHYKVNTYILCEKPKEETSEASFETVKTEIHQDIPNGHKVVITFENGKVTVNAYPSKVA